MIEISHTIIKKNSIRGTAFKIKYSITIQMVSVDGRLLKFLLELLEEFKKNKLDNKRKSAT